MTKERQVVGEGDDAVIVEGTSSDDDDEETLQLRNSFSDMACKCVV
jgi:hypothetical protein